MPIYRRPPDLDACVASVRAAGYEGVRKLEPEELAHAPGLRRASQQEQLAEARREPGRDLEDQEAVA